MYVSVYYIILIFSVGLRFFLRYFIKILFFLWNL